MTAPATPGQADSFDSPDGQTCSAPPLPPLPPKWTGKFRKRPVEVEAVQLIDDLRNHTEVAAWIEGNGGHAEIPFAEPCLFIETLEGTMRADIGWWVVRGVRGEFYPVHPDIFEETYQPAAGASLPGSGGMTPQQAYETWRAAIPDVVCNIPGGPWEDLPVTVQAGFEAIAGRQPAPGHLMVMRGTIALRDAEIELLRGQLARTREEAGAVRRKLDIASTALCRLTTAAYPAEARVAASQALDAMDRVSVRDAAAPEKP